MLSSEEDGERMGFRCGVSGISGFGLDRASHVPSLEVIAGSWVFIESGWGSRVVSDVQLSTVTPAGVP
jgi:hypothetical protein